MPYEPPDPPNPPAPVQPEAQTAAQKAGYWGETKESGSDPTRGEKHWDPQWEKRARKILGSDVVGGLGDLYDPEHRKQLNRMLRAKKGKGGKAAAAPVEEVAEVTDTGVEESDGGLKPVAQGGRKQWEDIEAGQQLGGLFPERRVPGDEGREAMPGGNMDEDRTDPDAVGTPAGEYQTGLWSDEDQARAQDAQRGTAGGTETGDQAQTGFWGPEDQARAGESGDVTAEDQRAALDTGLWTGPEAGGEGVRLPTEDWPPRKIPVTFYTGGM